jgi:galactokinase
MIILDRVRDAFRGRFGGEPQGIARAPGRVNLLGEHVDYNDGFVLPAAIDRATCLAFRLSGSGDSCVAAADFAEEIQLSTRGIESKTNAEGKPLPGWALYPAGVAWSLAQAGEQTPGLDAVYSSDVPTGAGLSSSASVELAFAAAWQSVSGGRLSAMELAKLCQKAENQYVGVNCGIMDQFASACGRQGHALLLDCRSLEWQAIPLPDGVSIVIADTAVRRNLVDSAYNDRRAACEQAVRILREALPEIRALRDVRQKDFNRLEFHLPEGIRKRAQYVIEETERMRTAPILLRQGDLRGFGRLMNECHAGLRDLYGVSCQELDAMVEIAQSLPGCLGARLTGGGFGGCTVNLVESTTAESFARELSTRYGSRTGKRAEVYICKAADGAQVGA